MNNNRTNTKCLRIWEQTFGWLLFLSVCFVVLSVACTSRLSINLYLTLDDDRSKVKIENQDYFNDTELSDPRAENKIVSGDNACVVFETGTRGIRVETTNSNLFGYDEYLRCRVFVELTDPPSEGLVDLIDKSFVQVLGRFEQTSEKKIFTYSDGSIMIDSVVSNKVYMAFDANYQNSSKERLRLDGQIKIKTR